MTLNRRKLKGLSDISTRSSIVSDLANPQRRYLLAASLELKKSLCKKVQNVAKKRVEEMAEKLREIEAEEAALLDANLAHGIEVAKSRDSSDSDIDSRSGKRKGFSLKY